MKLLENLSVILVIPDLQSKTKLREVLRSVLYKGEVAYERNLKDLSKNLTAPTPVKTHLTFISGKIPEAEINEFLSSIESMAEKDKPAIIVALPSASAMSSGTIAGLYLKGVSGFISDPYTADDISTLLVKILEQKSKNPIEGEQKSRKASSFLLADAMSLVDETARLNLEGKEGGYALRDLKNLSKSFSEFFEKDPEGYTNAIVEVFQKAKAPAWAKGVVRKKQKAKFAKHPGALVWEMMSQRGIAEDRLPGLLKIEPDEAAALTRGNLQVSEALAQSLARVFGMTAREWLKLQKDFDAYQASMIKGQ